MFIPFRKETVANAVPDFLTSDTKKKSSFSFTVDSNHKWLLPTSPEQQTLYEP